MWVYLAIVLPVPLALLCVIAWYRKLRWNYKYGDSTHQTVASCSGKGGKGRRPRRRSSLLTVIRDLTDFTALIWRNPEMSFVDMYHALDAGKPRSESMYYSWGSLSSKTAETEELGRAVYRRGLELYPDSGLLRESFLSLLMDRKDWHGVAQEAACLGWFASGRSRYRTYLCLGYAQIQMGNYEAAVQAYTMALKLKPDCAKTVAALRYCREQWTTSGPADPA